MAVEPDPSRRFSKSRNPRHSRRLSTATHSHMAVVAVASKPPQPRPTATWLWQILPTATRLWSLRSTATHSHGSLAGQSVRGPGSVVRGPRSVVRGPWPVARGPWSMDLRPWGSGRQSAHRRRNPKDAPIWPGCPRSPPLAVALFERPPAMDARTAAWAGGRIRRRPSHGRLPGWDRTCLVSGDLDPGSK